MAEDQQPAIHEQDTPPMLTHSQTPLTQAISSPILADVSTAHSGVRIRHSPPTAQTASNFLDPARFTALEGMVNHLATNMTTNMTELMAMVRNQNQASSSFIPPPEPRPIVDPSPVVPPAFVSEVEDASFSAMAYAPTVHPISDPLSPPPALTAVPLPPAAFLFAESTTHASAPKIKILDFKRIGARLVYDPENRRRPYMDRSFLEVPRPVSILCRDTPYSSRSQYDKDERGPTKRCRLTSRPRQPLSSRNLRNLHNNMLLLRLNKGDPRLRDLLNRLNVFQPRELNRVVMLNRVRASSTLLYQLLPLTYLGSFLQATRLEQRHPVPISILLCRTKIYAANFTRVLLVTLWILVGHFGTLHKADLL
ncbi:hypothetical protein CRG98_028830 [Punica granatum]|uniref:Uncharacterized protein n=1 Tax=Punica granatum TaxID=22663 RepID=A0A2I0J4X3_PUNGR|nr:hypothetical protein CRG98_028830 [Punica granatum]